VEEGVISVTKTEAYEDHIYFGVSDDEVWEIPVDYVSQVNVEHGPIYLHPQNIMFSAYKLSLWGKIHTKFQVKPELLLLHTTQIFVSYTC